MSTIELSMRIRSYSIIGVQLLLIAQLTFYLYPRNVRLSKIRGLLNVRMDFDVCADCTRKISGRLPDVLLIGQKKNAERGPLEEQETHKIKFISKD